MSWGIGMRWQVAGRIPASNMYESMLFLGWGVGLFAVVATVLMRNRIVVLNAAAGAALTMALTDLLPIDRFIHPMPPVLSGTYWLAIHVPIIMVGYAVLALGMVVAHMQIGVEAFAPARRTLALKMAELQYFYIHVGSILLVAGILTGSMWAASSWGRYWGWDPKEVWSLVAFLAYMAILHARAERLIGTFGVAAWSIVAFQTILMTYLGVNFVLAAGLHSYGFGDSSVVRAMVITALVEGDLHRRRLGQAPEEASSHGNVDHRNACSRCMRARCGERLEAVLGSWDAQRPGNREPQRPGCAQLPLRWGDSVPPNPPGLPDARSAYRPAARSRAWITAQMSSRPWPWARADWNTSRIAARPGMGTPWAAPCSSISVWSLTSRSIAKCSWKSRFAIAAPLKA